MTEPHSADIRQYLTTAYGDEDLTTFCFDYFRDVYDNFTAGMTKGQKIQLLLDRCQRRETFPDLLAALERDRAPQYRKRFGVAVEAQPAPLQPVRDVRQVFISHAYEDAEVAHRLAADLRMNGWRIWIAPESIRAGEKWVEAINRGLDESGAFVVLLSPAAVQSSWVRDETNVAIDLQHQGCLHFIPAEIKTCNLPSFWRVYQRIPLTARYEDGLAALVAALTAARRQPMGAVVDPVQYLRAELTHADPAVRTQAARGLARLGAADDATIAALLRLYPADPTDAPRHAALEALLALGRHADMGMVLVPAGEFLMGSADDDREADGDEKPQHRIYLPAYALDRTPATNAQYRRFIEAGGYANSAYWKEAITAGRWKDSAYIDYDNKPRSQPFYWGDAQWNGDPQPVVGVSWYEALAYARWAGKRLPTEAEWEKAASWEVGGHGDAGIRGGGDTGRKRRYPWNDAWDVKRCNTEESGIKKTTPVGTYSPAGDSPCGAADMAGNVWEWCSTRWGFRYPYDPDDGREDLGGGDSVGRVFRGGSWYTDRKWARCAYRLRYDPWLWYYDWGFRCCVSTSSPSGGSGS